MIYKLLLDAVNKTLPLQNLPIINYKNAVRKNSNFKNRRKNTSGLFLESQTSERAFCLKFCRRKCRNRRWNISFRVSRWFCALKATTEIPKCEVGEFVWWLSAILPSGAFMDGELLKIYLFPYKQQKVKTLEGKRYLSFTFM